MSTLLSFGNTLYTIATNPIDSLMGLIGSIIISITSLVLYFASTVFELILDATVIGFGATLTQYGILDGIQLVWSAFRDISNIIIIGMFVFVAISMILGNATYGTKKFVARVLVVAVLINFSLLFTQLVIDTSNLAANQFYKGVRAAVVNNQAVFQETTQGTIEQAADTLWNKQGGVAGAFMNKMGISSFFDTAGMVASVADSQTNWLKSVGLAMFFTFVVVVLIIATAAVFLYGAYLMTARALLLIFLLATSSIAFAAWLVPKYGEGKYGWSGWLETLIQNAVFAPMLMIMLWASLVILSKAPTGSLGAFIQHPDASSPQEAMATVVVYLFTLGMLYLSLKISSSFSKKITGFNIATAALNIGGRWAGGAVGMSSRLGVRAIERTGLPVKADKGRLWSPVGGPAGNIERALAFMTDKALKSAHKASFNPARLPQALSEKFDNLDKRYGFSAQGKGGNAAADKRAETAREEALKEMTGAMTKASKASDTERAKILKDTLKETVDASKQNATEQTKALERLSTAHEEMLRQVDNLNKEEQYLPAGSIEQQNVAVQRKEMQRKVEESAERIEKAALVAEKAKKDAEDTPENKTRWEREALENMSGAIAKLEAVKEHEYLEKKYPGEEGVLMRQKVLSFTRRQRKVKDISQALSEFQKKEDSGQSKTKPDADKPH
ncbi:hypothetical protein HY413_03505 [Candidatus Kaiserbacteria bacterium]|nr:hypothetical protein [Candidatus Kaiserbacteria bacterium]